MKRQAGFTLVEIAIVLVIIGLLLGGVLKGQELIESAKVKSIAQDFRSISVAVLTYQDRYRAMPGDDASTTSHFGAGACVPQVGSSGTVGDGVIDGQYKDNATTSGSNSSGSEAACVWDHLRRANLITGGVGDTSHPKHADAGTFGIVSGSAAPPITGLKGSLIVCADNIRGNHVIPLDAMLDDGNASQGSMMAAPTSSPGTPIQSGVAPDPNQGYTVCMGF